MKDTGPSGHVLIEVDDVATMGDKAHDQTMAKLRSTFKFGMWRSIYGSEGDYAGRTLVQYKDYSFKVHQAKFIQERLQPISIPRGRRSDKKSPTWDGEKKQLRGVLGGLAWVQREARPDAAAATP